jgi:hypothetical protein
MSDQQDFRDMLGERHGFIMDGLTKIEQQIAILSARQLVQNGRVGTLESKVAVMEDRNPNRIAGAISAGVAGLIAGLAAWAGK